MTSKTYSEVWSILKILGESYISKLPSKLVEFINEEKDTEYNPIYSIEEDFESQNISEDALAFVTFLNLKYWCDEEEKSEILNILRENDKKAELKLEFEEINKVEEKEESISTLDNEEKRSLVVQEKVSFKSKIINIIKSIFKHR